MTIRLQDWFRHDVADKLEDVVGGPARLRVIVLLAGTLALSSADTATVGAAAAPLQRSLGIDNTRLGLLVTVSTLVGAVATMPVGVAVDRHRRTSLLAGAIVVWSAALVVSAFSVSYLMLVLTRLALGAMVAVAGPAVASLTGDFFAPSERGRVYGYMLSGELVGAGAGILISGDIAGWFSWRLAFAWLVVPGLALAWAVARKLPEPDRGGKSRLRPGARQIPSAADAPAAPPTDTIVGGAGGEGSAAVADEVDRQRIEPHRELVLHSDVDRMPSLRAARYILSIRTNVLLIVASALGYFFYAGIRTFAVEYARGRFGMGQSAATSLLVLIAAGAAIGVLAGGRFADRLIRRGILAARPFVAGFALLAATALFLAGLLATALLVAVPLLFFAAAAYSATNPALDAARLDVMQHHLWGRAEAVRTVLRSLLEAAAPLLFGYVSSRLGGSAAGLSTVAAPGQAVTGSAGLQHTFLIMLAPLALSALLLLFAARRTYPRDVATAVASEQNTSHEPDSR